MPRGRASNLGDVMTNANGYSQTKTEDGWKGTHIVILEKKLGRKLSPGERAIFIDGDKTNLAPDNIELVAAKKISLRTKIARLRAEIEDRKALLEVLEHELKEQE